MPDDVLETNPINETVIRGTTYTRQQLIDAYQSFHKEYPDTKITRDFFRGRSNIPESAWTNLFGSFANMVSASLPEDAPRNNTAWLPSDERQLRSLISDGSSVEQIAIAMNRSVDAIRRKARRMGVDGITSAMVRETAAKEDNRPLAGGVLHSPIRTRPTIHGKRFVFTAAQNNTYVHENFLKSLEVYCEHNDAALCISKFRYNKNAFQNLTSDHDGDELRGQGEELWFAPELEPYFVDYSCNINDGSIVWCGELDILPTAVNPLSGLESYTGRASSIIPHAKVRMQSVPTSKDEYTKFMYTTGTVTLRNYIKKKAGQKAEFHHVFGALVVEFDENGEWYARQLLADDDGTFYDLHNFYTPDGVFGGKNPEMINFGDIHVDRMSEERQNELATILNQYRPKYCFLHDIIDFAPRNHHNINSPFFRATRYFDVSEGVEDEIDTARTFVQKLNGASPDTEVVVVESNHDQAFKRWLEEADGHRDPRNAEYWHYWNYQMFKALREGKGSTYNLLAEAMSPCVATFLNEDDSFEVLGIECGMHGHRGPNGSRGAPNNLKNIGKKSNTGHTHSAGIVDGVYTAGLAADLSMDYAKGPSSWSHSMILTYPNGKRTIVTFRGDRHTA